MKNLLLVLSLLFFSFSYAQTYLPMLENGNVWNVLVENGPKPFTYSNTTLSIDGEQVINGVTYKVLSGCLLREENGVVFRYDSNTASEVLFLDFTLDVADTFTYLEGCVVPDPADFNPLHVITKTTQFIAGADRIVLEMDYEPANGNNAIVERWVEGIGSLRGVEPNTERFDYGLTVLCFTNNGNTYLLNDADACEFLGVNDFSLASIKLAPNPVMDISRLHIPSEAAIDQFRVFDLAGRLIQDITISEENNIIITSNDYTSSMYFYQVLSNSEVKKTASFIVN